MILQEHPFGISRMAHNLMHALSPLWISLILRQKLRAHSVIAGLPVFASIIGAINAAGRDCHVKTFRVRRIRKHGVQAQSTAAGHPLRTMWMVVESAHQRPAFAGVS